MSVANGWHHYVERIVTEHASQQQMRDLRRTYYAGAAHLLESLLEATPAGTTPTLEETLVRIAAVKNELTTFMDAVLDGQA